MGLEDVLNVGDVEPVADLASILNGVASLQCRAQIVVLSLKTIKPFDLLRPSQPGVCGYRERQAVVEVPVSQDWGLTARAELLHSVLADCLQHPEAGFPTRSLILEHQAHGHQRCHPVQYVGAEITAGVTHRLGRLKVQPRTKMARRRKRVRSRSPSRR